MAFVAVVRAVYDYAPQSDEELEIKDGDLLFVLEKDSDDDWWKCKKKAASEDEDEPEGLVPNNYVEEVKPTHPAKALYDYTKQTDEELSFQEGAQLQVYDQTDPDWTLVGKDGAYGFVPAIYIEHLPAGSVAAPPLPLLQQCLLDHLQLTMDHYREKRITCLLHRQERRLRAQQQRWPA